MRYIILAAHLAGQPDNVQRVEMTLTEVEALVGGTLPGNARFPSWWRNDDRKTHSRAWLTAGWEVVEMTGAQSKVVFARRAGA